MTPDEWYERFIGDAPKPEQDLWENFENEEFNSDYHRCDRFGQYCLEIVGVPLDVSKSWYRDRKQHLWPQKITWYFGTKHPKLLQKFKLLERLGVLDAES